MLNNDINLRLRTKFLLSLVLITACLTCATLLVVRRSAPMRVQREIQQEALNTVLTFDAVHDEHQVVLSRKADLLASLAFMRNGDATTIQDVGEDPWQSGDCDLFVLADPNGKIVALHSTIPEFPIVTAEYMLDRSLKEENTAGWWY